MLPGIRFLFAAIVLTLSMLVFGLGAAALLRAAHEEFASSPTRRGASVTTVAQQFDISRPTLSLLQVDAPAIDSAGIVHLKAADVSISTPSISTSEATSDVPGPESNDTTIVEPESERAKNAVEKTTQESAKISQTSETLVVKADTIAALTTIATPGEIQPAAVAEKSEPLPPDATAADAIPSTQAAETKTTSVNAATVTVEAATSPATVEAIDTGRDQPSVPVVTSAASTKIATLGGPPVAIEDRVSATLKPDVRLIAKKRVRARRNGARRRLIRQAQLARQQLIKPAVPSPFGSPFGN